MFDHLLTDEHRRVRDEAREFVKTTPRELILDMDAERVHFPKEWLREAAHRRLLGVRHPVRWGGRGLDWVAASAVSEEIGSLSYELACVFGVGADLVCDAILSHGTDAQKERYVAPLLKPAAARNSPGDRRPPGSSATAVAATARAPSISRKGIGAGSGCRSARGRAKG